MSDATLRALEQAVRTNPGDEPARVALDIERRRRGMGSLWGYAPRWCGDGEDRHLLGSRLYGRCATCWQVWEEITAHVDRQDAVTNRSHWQRDARRTVAVVSRVMPPGASTREVRAMLRAVRPGKGCASIERQWFSREVVRAFPALGRTKPLGPEDSPLFVAKAVPHAP